MMTCRLRLLSVEGLDHHADRRALRAGCQRFEGCLLFDRLATHADVPGLGRLLPLLGGSLSSSLRSCEEAGVSSRTSRQPAAPRSPLLLRADVTIYSAAGETVDEHETEFLAIRIRYQRPDIGAEIRPQNVVFWQYTRGVK